MQKGYAMKYHQRILAAVLCICLSVGLAGCGSGNLTFEEPGGGQRPQQTVTPPSQREVVDCSVLTAQPFDAEAFLARVEAARALLQQKDSGEQILQEYRELTALLREALTQYTVSEINYYLDSGSEELQQASAQAYTAVNDCNDAYSVFLSELSNSDYSGAYADEVGSANAAVFQNYEAQTEEQKALLDREKELEDEYTALAGESYDTYEATAQVMAPLYVELIDVRNRLAESYGYDDYPTYAYETTYGRSYTPADARGLEENVKDGLAKRYVRLMLNITEEDYAALYRYPDASEENLLALMRQYLPQMDAGFDEALEYMLACHAYDIAYSDSKYDASFTTMLYSWNVPYLFSQPNPDSQADSLDTLVHEFGHYYAYLNDPTYASDDGFVYSADNIDVAEIHSTALELLFLRNYPELYGDDAEPLRRMVLTDILSNVVMGCIFDEFQQRVYTQEDLQPEDVSEIFHDVFLDYMGDIYIDDYAYYMWSVVNHNFDAPLYYISYGVSALAAFQIWETSLEDPDAALQQYLELTAWGTDVDFQALLKKCGMQDVFDDEFLTGLSRTLRSELQ